MGKRSREEIWAMKSRKPLKMITRQSIGLQNAPSNVIFRIYSMLRGYSARKFSCICKQWRSALFNWTNYIKVRVDEKLKPETFSKYSFLKKICFNLNGLDGDRWMESFEETLRACLCPEEIHLQGCSKNISKLDQLSLLHSSKKITKVIAHCKQPQPICLNEGLLEYIELSFPTLFPMTTLLHQIKVSHLRSLVMYRCLLSSQDFHHLANARFLQHLELCLCALPSNPFEKVVSTCKYLTSVVLRFCIIDESTLLDLVKLPLLNRLEIC